MITQYTANFFVQAVRSEQSTVKWLVLFCLLQIVQQGAHLVPMNPHMGVCVGLHPYDVCAVTLCLGPQKPTHVRLPRTRKLPMYLCLCSHLL